MMRMLVLVDMKVDMLMLVSVMVDMMMMMMMIPICFAASDFI